MIPAARFTYHLDNLKKGISLMKRVLLLSIAMLGVAGTANAEFNYTFIQGSIGMVDFDDADADGTGFGLDASLALNDDFHVFAAGSLANLSRGVDLTQLAGGVGYNTAINDRVDIVAQLSFRSIEADGRGGSADDSGIGLGVFARFAATDQLELNGGLDHDEAADSTALTGAALYNIDEQFTVGLTAKIDDDVTIFSLAGRMYFY